VDLRIPDVSIASGAGPLAEGRSNACASPERTEADLGDGPIDVAIGYRSVAGKALSVR